MSCTKKLPLALFVSHLSMFTPLFVGPSDSHSTSCHDLMLMLDLLLCHLGHHHGSSPTSVCTYINACNFLCLALSLQGYHRERKLFSLCATWQHFTPPGARTCLSTHIRNFATVILTVCSVMGMVSVLCGSSICES